MQTLAVPINKAETIALAEAHLIQKGIAANSRGILIQADQMAETEDGIARPRRILMGGMRCLSLLRVGGMSIWTSCDFRDGEKRKQKMDIA
jgi:hypothetical protein